MRLCVLPPPSRQHRLKFFGTWNIVSIAHAAKSPYITRYCCSILFDLVFSGTSKEESMAWTTPVLVEICIGLEINGYMPTDGYAPPEF